MNVRNTLASYYAAGKNALLTRFAVSAESQADSDDTQQTEDIEHAHRWQRGILPGPTYVRQCKDCPASEVITRKQWDTTC